MDCNLLVGHHSLEIESFTEVEPFFYIIIIIIIIIIKGVYAPASPTLGCRLVQKPPGVTVLHFEIFEYRKGICGFIPTISL